jgi:hypothetical protein
MEYATPLPARPTRPWALVGIGVTTVLAGAIFGAGTNAINGAVSPTYFVNVMGWYVLSTKEEIWWASVGQGVLEGSALGLLFSVILTTSIGIITRATCGYGIGMRWLGYIMLTILGMWIAGGACNIWFANSHPVWFQNYFIRVPRDHTEMLRYAWVGGSMMGAEAGGLLAVITGVILFRMSWRRMLKGQCATTWA